MAVKKIVSGGQTGVDRAGLDAAIKLGLQFGGYCPKGGYAEDGQIDIRKYHLVETVTSDYQERTRLNVINSDATIIFFSFRLGPGSELTREYCEQYSKPCCVISVDPIEGAKDHLRFSLENRPKWQTLNIAGSRESKHPGMYKIVMEILLEVLPQFV